MHAGHRRGRRAGVRRKAARRGAPTLTRCIVCDGDAADAFEAGGIRVARCRGCGLEWRDPMPDEAALSGLYGEAYLERWGGSDAASRARVRAMKETSYEAFLRAVGRHRSGGRLLDVGCALGYLLPVAERAGYEAYGVDRNEAAVREARREFGDRVHAGPLADDAFRGLDFDVVTMIDLLEHVPEPNELLATVRARLGRGGVIAAVLPDVASRMRRLLGRRWPHYAPEHLWYWSPDCLSRHLASQGFRVLELRTGLRKTYTPRYLHAYSATLGRRLPALPGPLADLRIRIPTGEMLVVAGVR